MFRDIKTVVSGVLGRPRQRGFRLVAALLASAAVSPSAVKAEEARAFAIPAGPLGDALNAFGRQTGFQLAYRPEAAAGRSSAGVSGAATPSEALGRLLAGTGLSYRLTSARAAAITGPARGADAAAGAPSADGSMLLDPIQIMGASGVAPADAPYHQPAPTAHISAETIERFRGSSPADIFRGTPGVMSGEARNGAGAVDVNIRGMQGMGRVATTIDGAENAMTIYQGYQGVSNRTFMDPDLLGGVDITKGSDASSFGVAGTVAMRTLDASDIVAEGKDYGVRVKGGFGTNTTKPTPNALGGYNWPGAWSPPVATPSATGLDRPGFLNPSSGFGSAVAAVKQDSYELIGGFAYRKQGNYFAGEHGPGAKPVHTGPRTECNENNWCQTWTDYIENAGIANYRAGEEVLNTQLETKSWLLKGKVDLGDGQSLQLGYTGFRSETGARIASRLPDERSQPSQIAQTTGTDLDTGTARYRWNPADTPLIDLTANVYWSHLEVRNPLLTGWMPPKKGDFRPGADTDMWGGEVANTSKFDLSAGALDLTYGVAYRGEDTRPSKGTPAAETWLDYRDALRNEAAGYVKSVWKPREWLALNGGLRYSHYWTKDRNDPGENWDRGYDYRVKRSEGGFSPSLGVTVEPLDGVQLYTTYSSTLRAPSLIESATGFTMGVNSNIKPERSRNWEFGANFRKESLLGADDKLMLKANYFNWDVKDYIARQWHQFPDTGYWGMQIFNIARAKFEGLEFSGTYQSGGFKADLTANYYTDVTFCRTADTCEHKSLYSDYSTNHVPPKYSVSLTLSQTVWEKLTLGGRVQHVGKRAIGHGDATAQGMSQFIALVNWKPYTLVDVFAEYKINEYLTANVGVENLTDRYYIDPLSLVLQPAPGRTFTASLAAKF